MLMSCKFYALLIKIRIGVLLLKKTLLAIIASVLASGGVLAQSECVELEGTPPGLYVFTDEGRTLLLQDDEILEMGPGEAGFADQSGLQCIERIPQFMDWPCATDAAKSRRFNTYSIEDLESENQPLEIVRRYFEIPEVIEPIPNWIEGEYHMKLDRDQILQFQSEEHWYLTDPDRDLMDDKRPKTLLIPLYLGINQVTVDKAHYRALAAHYGNEPIPVVFGFNDSNVVPISYFGENVSLEEILKANQERSIVIDDVPMWELGDHNIQPSIEEMRTFFDIPNVEDIPVERRAALEFDLEANGFSKKPIFISLLSSSGSMVVDQPERVAVAAAMGMSKIPVYMTIVQPDIPLQRCGPGIPAGFNNVSISGESTPPGGAALPAGSAVVPPPTEPPASGS
jgi:hypothetical protein